VFSAARWRLTLWFAVALAMILAVIGAAVYFTARAVLFDEVNDELRARAHVELRLLTDRLIDRGRRGQPVPGVLIGPQFTAGGYFYALVSADGGFLAGTPNVDPLGLADTTALQDAAQDGPTFVDTTSTHGEDLRVYVLPVEGIGSKTVLFEVGRSTEPERQALRRLVLVLAGGGGVGLVLAIAGGFVLAGRALSPIRTAMDRQRGFVADASHELRTPLSLIRANAEVLKRHPDETVNSSMSSVDDIIQETDRLSGLVGQMLTLARTDAGNARIEVTDVDLAQLTTETTRQMRTLAEPQRISIDVQAGGPLFVRGDAGRLKELVTILVDNAVKYNRPDGSVSISVLPESGRVRLQVQDTGRGIPPESLPHIFDRFYRVDKARSRELGGTGLGLAIAKWIVKSHGGAIRVDSAVDAGTSVTVVLPAQTRA
jgi:signal transduction histidine kinase